MTEYDFTFRKVGEEQPLEARPEDHIAALELSARTYVAYIRELETKLTTIEKALPHLLSFRISPTFDAKGTYTQSKGDEWAKRLTDFSDALRAAYPKKCDCPIYEKQHRAGCKEA